MYRPCSNVVNQRYEASAGQRSSSRRVCASNTRTPDDDPGAAPSPIANRTRPSADPTSVRSTALADAARPSVQAGGVPAVGRSATRTTSTGAARSSTGGSGLPPPALQQVEREQGVPLRIPGERHAVGGVDQDLFGIAQGRIPVDRAEVRPLSV